MRIGLFAHRLAPLHPTGVGRYVRELVRSLDRCRCQDDELVLASAPEESPAGWLPPGLEPHVLEWHRAAVQLAWSAGWGPRLERALGELDVVHLLQPFPPARSSAPQVVTVHDLFPFERPEWYTRREGWTARRGTVLALPRAARIVAPSRFVAEQLQARFDLEPTRVAVVPHGVSGIFSPAASRPEPAAICTGLGLTPGRFAVCLGAVSARKNVITLVRAAPTLSANGIALVMVGPDGPDVRQVTDECARLPDAVSVIRTGFLPDADAAALVRAAGVVVHPALGEGFGLVPLEAMAVGTPVIAARTSAVPEVVGDAAILLDEATDPQAWAQAIASLVEDERRSAELSAAGERRAALFTWERSAAATLEVYREATCI